VTISTPHDHLAGLVARGLRGHYGPLFIRMAWHSAGTYRVMDGRGGAGGGQQRFEPLNSWPDNANLDKARRLLWPVKQKYGENMSWADLMVLAGTVAMEDMGFKTASASPAAAKTTGSRSSSTGARNPNAGRRALLGEGSSPSPLAAVQMGLIYVNPEGPNGKPDPQAGRSRHPRDLRSHGDERRGDRGPDRGRPHLRQGPRRAQARGCLGPEPAGEGVEDQGLGWKNRCGKGNAEDTITSGLEGAWTAAPTQWSMMYLATSYNYEWEQTRSPAGAVQWVPRTALPLAPCPMRMSKA
jgi:catalase-peroxidase